MPPMIDLLAAIGDTASPLAMPPVAQLSDTELIEGQRQLAELRRRVDALSAPMNVSLSIRHSRMPRRG